jgi:hypothetical protein
VVTGSFTIDVEESPDYIPAVGDVVEFEWNGDYQKGLIYQSDDYSKELAVVHGEDSFTMYCRVSYEHFSNFRKVGYAESVPSDSLSYDIVIAIAKAYFAQPTFTGSYAERQAQWIEHHGLKVGDKVKVVRKFKGQEDGYSQCGWDFNAGKAEMMGKECTIGIISSNDIELIHDDNCGWYFPYFALEPVK